MTASHNMQRMMVILVSGIALLIMCSTSDFAGNSAETGNARIAGRVTGTESGVAHVRLLPRNYDPVADGTLPERFTTISDSMGMYAFDSVAPGFYNVLAIGQSADMIALSRNIEHGATVTTIVATDTLRAAGTLVLAVPQVDTSWQAYIVIPGTGISAQLQGEQRDLVIGSLPSGLLPPVLLRERIGSREAVLADSADIPVGDTLNLDGMLPLAGARKITINTTVFGSGIDDTVRGFPVLVRLTETGFPFDSTAPGGADLRVTRNGSSPVPFEIESWCDTCVPRTATVWIAIDTIYGNHFWTAAVVHFGNGSIPVSSSPVFGARDNFVAVYHMDEQESGAAAAGEIMDATDNGLHASTNPAVSVPRLVSSVVGRGREFDGIDDYIRIDHDSRLLPGPDMSVSLWVRLHELPASRNESAFLIAKRDSVAPWQSYYLAIDRNGNLPMFLWRDSSDNGYTAGRYDGVAADTWYYLAFVKTGSGLTAHINADTANCWSYNPSGTMFQSSGSLYIGSTEGKQERLRGVLDEVRIESVAREHSWVRLCYENQRQDQRLVSIR